ncbi:MAG TPA: HEAT repeat domain-containing protein [Polyangia bacterium]|nr:HEAT repeat domain-containing protein [Polyangia bacterium]
MRTLDIGKIGLGMVVLTAFSQAALAGRGGSTGAIISAVNSGSSDAIVAEIERAEELACLSCIAPVQKLVDYPDARVRDAAGWWLGRRGVRDEVIASMTSRLSLQDPQAARNAADVLGGMRDFSTLAALSAYMKHPLDEESGIAAARAIGAIGHPTGLAALQAGFGSTLPGVRAASLQAVRNLRAPIGSKTVTSAGGILPLLADADAGVRLQAALTCGFLQDKTATSALAGVATGDASPLVRKAAAWAIGEIGDASGAAALTQAQNDADPLVRSVATGALGRLTH